MYPECVDTGKERRRWSPSPGIREGRDRLRLSEDLPGCASLLGEPARIDSAPSEAVKGEEDDSPWFGSALGKPALRVSSGIEGARGGVVRRDGRCDNIGERFAGARGEDPARRSRSDSKAVSCPSCPACCECREGSPSCAGRWAGGVSIFTFFARFARLPPDNAGVAVVRPRRSSRCLVFRNLRVGAAVEEETPFDMKLEGLCSGVAEYALDGGGKGER